MATTVGELIAELSNYDALLPVVLCGLDGFGYSKGAEPMTVRIRESTRRIVCDYEDAEDAGSSFTEGSEPFTAIYIG